ncbi:MAG: Multidrug resistance transporter, Bcr/CflA family, partial [uncultured Rubellimicrobium sp.]
GLLSRGAVPRPHDAAPYRHADPRLRGGGALDLDLPALARPYGRAFRHLLRGDAVRGVGVPADDGGAPDRAGLGRGHVRAAARDARVARAVRCGDAGHAGRAERGQLPRVPDDAGDGRGGDRARPRGGARHRGPERGRVAHRLHHHGHGADPHDRPHDRRRAGPGLRLAGVLRPPRPCRRRGAGAGRGRPGGDVARPGRGALGAAEALSGAAAVAAVLGLFALRDVRVGGVLRAPGRRVLRGGANLRAVAALDRDRAGLARHRLCLGQLPVGAVLRARGDRPDGDDGLRGGDAGTVRVAPPHARGQCEPLGLLRLLHGAGPWERDDAAELDGGVHLCAARPRGDGLRPVGRDHDGGRRGPVGPRGGGPVGGDGLLAASGDHGGKLGLRGAVAAVAAGNAL